jgi:hypothetical protein
MTLQIYPADWQRNMSRTSSQRCLKDVGQTAITAIISALLARLGHSYFKLMRVERMPMVLY